MNVAVVGLGGIGGYYGGKLALRYAGSTDHRITFIARGEHLAAIREKGLRLITVEGTFNVTPHLATDRPEEVGACDLVLLCVKGYDLEAAAAAISPLLNEKTVILPLLNGVDISDRLRALLSKGVVLSGCVYISTFIEAPGVIRQIGGPCQLFFGPDVGQTDEYGPLEEFFKAAEIKAELSAEIAVRLWAKYLLVSPMAGVTSLTGKTFGAVMADEKGSEMVRGLMKEIDRLAYLKGIMLPADSVEAAIEKTVRYPYETKSSMQLDYEKGRRTEMDTFIGYPVRAGRALGLPMPIYEELYTALKGKAS